MLLWTGFSPCWLTEGSKVCRRVPVSGPASTGEFPALRCPCSNNPTRFGDRSSLFCRQSTHDGGRHHFARIGPATPDGRDQAVAAGDYRQSVALVQVPAAAESLRGPASPLFAESTAPPKCESWVETRRSWHVSIQEVFHRGLLLSGWLVGS